MGTITMIMTIITIIIAIIKPISSVLNFSVEMGLVFVVISGSIVVISGLVCDVFVDISGLVWVISG